MNGNVLGEAFEPYVTQQINLRQKTQGSGLKDKERTIEQMNYLNNRNAWVKLASGVSIEGENRLEHLDLSVGETPTTALSTNHS